MNGMGLHLPQELKDAAILGPHPIDGDVRLKRRVRDVGRRGIEGPRLGQESSLPSRGRSGPKLGRGLEVLRHIRAFARAVGRPLPRHPDAEQGSVAKDHPQPQDDNQCRGESDGKCLEFPLRQIQKASRRARPGDVLGFARGILRLGHGLVIPGARFGSHRGRRLVGSTLSPKLVPERTENTFVR